MTDFLERFLERKIAQWILAYLGGAWLLLQVVELLGDLFGWPAAVLRVVPVLLGVGLLAAVVLAWYHGEKGRQGVSGVELVMLGGILVLAGTGVALVSPGAPGPAADEAAADVGGSSATDDLPRSTVAVLPFDNLSPDPSDAYFADGVHEEILAQLAGVRGLRVISRTSVMQYRDAGRSIREIGRELGAGAVLEGSVRRAGDRVRVTVQLIDAREDVHEWSETYDRKLEDIFAIQSEIARSVAAELEGELTSAEASGVGRRPTSDVEAYDLYLRAQGYGGSGLMRESGLRAQVALYERALELDPDFALAWAGLSRAHNSLWWFHFDRDPDRLERALAAAERSLELEPDLFEGRMAMAWYHYHGHLDYERALEELDAAAGLRPGTGDVAYGRGAILRRQGRMEEAVRAFREAAELDPRSSNMAFQTGETYALLRDFPNAVEQYDRAIRLRPDWGRPYAFKARAQLRLDGDLAAARATLAAAEEMGAESSPFVVQTGVSVALAGGPAEAALERLERYPGAAIATQFAYEPVEFLRALVHEFRGAGREVARPHYEAAVEQLESVAERTPEDSRVHSALGRSYAGLGLDERAVRAARKGLELLPVEREAYRGYYRLEDFATVHARTGRDADALDAAERLLELPGDLTRAWLRLDPRWAGLESSPRFRALTKREPLDGR